MAARIKAHAGALAAALGLATLPLREQETRRLPVIGAVRLASDGAGLCVSATNFDGSVTAWTEAVAEGAVAVPLARLAALLAHFDGDAEVVITADADDRAATVTCGRSKFKLPVLPIADLLEPLTLGEETGRVDLEADAARDLFARPAFAASTEKNRVYLNGIFLHNVGDTLAATATDGHRLCRVTTPATSTLSADRSLIIPNPMVKSIDRLLSNTAGNVTLRRCDRLFSIESAAFVLVTKRIDATFPAYQQLLSVEAPNVVTVDRVRLRDAIARFAAIADPAVRTHIVGLSWDAAGLHLSAADGSEDCLAADVEGEAETAAQIHHLAELIGALHGDSVRLSVSGPGTIILVADPEDGNFLAGQMPTRLPS